MYLVNRETLREKRGAQLKSFGCVAVVIISNEKRAGEALRGSGRLLLCHRLVMATAMTNREGCGTFSYGGCGLYLTGI